MNKSIQKSENDVFESYRKFNIHAEPLYSGRNRFEIHYTQDSIELNKKINIWFKNIVQPNINIHPNTLELLQAFSDFFDKKMNYPNNTTLEIYAIEDIQLLYNHVIKWLLKSKEEMFAYQYKKNAHLSRSKSRSR